MVKWFIQLCFDVALVLDVESLEYGLVEQTLSCIVGLTVGLAAVFNEVKRKRQTPANFRICSVVYFDIMLNHSQSSVSS